MDPSAGTYWKIYKKNPAFLVLNDQRYVTFHVFFFFEQLTLNYNENDV